MRPINRFLVRHGIRIAQNPCISPDACLDWPALSAKLLQKPSVLRLHPKSLFETGAGRWTLLEDPLTGDCAWSLAAHAAADASGPLGEGITGGPGETFFPATWENLLRLKNLVQEFDPGSTIFPTCGETLGRSTLGIGARFTTLHWPAVEWAMSALGIGLTANQNSIPRELVYDVDAMLEGTLGTVPFPFIGADVPEGHQGQSVEGMSHGCVLSKLRTGFHRRRIQWAFNADHQPVGGPFDLREEALVRGCVLASYITFDLSPELALGKPAALGEIPETVLTRVASRVAAAGLTLLPERLEGLLCLLWPALTKMKKRDQAYREARERIFTTPVGRAYIREISIDELPGLTEPETTGVILALCEALGMPVAFAAPAFGFQKNTPFADNGELRTRVARQWQVVRQFDVGIGFHSGSGKSAENYRVLGETTSGCLEIKTSGRYTYEMGVALHASDNGTDQALWGDWYRFTLEMALAGAFDADDRARSSARAFISDSLAKSGKSLNVFGSPAECRAALEALKPSPDHMFFFEYNFLFILAAGGRPEKAALGDHTEKGFLQRSRFYAVSPLARLLYARGVAGYILFLAEHTGLASGERCAAARRLLARPQSYDEFLNDISR